MAVFATENANDNANVRVDVDEIQQYQMGRYISSNEGIWRIFAFSIHDRQPTVVHLSVHLENGQRVYFTAENAAERATTPPATTLTAFFTLCQEDPFAATLLYSEVPTYFTWNASTKKFQRRKQGKPLQGQVGIFSTNALGRVYTVHPSNAECFYLRMLLINVRGPKSFQQLRTVDGYLCPTYRDACQRLDLLESDTHWDTTLSDASLTSNPNQIRALFAIILTTCFPSDPVHLWDKHKDAMSEDFLFGHRNDTNSPDAQFTPEIYNKALCAIEDKCLAIVNKPLVQLGLPAPLRPATDLYDRDLHREQQYDPHELQSFVDAQLPRTLSEQRNVYNTIMTAVEQQAGGLYFLDAPGGTGKTFTISLILASIRAQNNIAVAVASSGIAATLLAGGRTAHSAFKLPLNLHQTDTPNCNIKKNSGMAKVLKACKLIVWDECTMAHKKSLEALDRTLKDLREDYRPFGGAVILLAGDYRQTLPVISKSTPADEINACLKSSVLWRIARKLTLTTNMRVHFQPDASSARFAEQLLQLGDGKMPIDPSSKCITLPSDFCDVTQTVPALIDKVFPSISINYVNHQWLCERAILAAKNNDVNVINLSIQAQIPGDCHTYKSVDSVTNQDEAVNYPIEFLNALDLPGLPPHILSLKIGAPIILLRNLNPPRLCNGTRLAVKRMMNNVIEATIFNGSFRGEDVLIPRIPMIPTDMPFEFKRLQFPIRLAFAMTINKAQGQTLQVCGINLENPCFSHGQLYVACSRVGKPSNLFIYAPDGRTKNVVYTNALQ